jgi:hypothetical protein
MSNVCSTGAAEADFLWLLSVLGGGPVKHLGQSEAKVIDAFCQ